MAFSVTVSGVSQVIKALRAVEKNIEDKKQEFMRRLAQIGIDTATTQFGKAKYDGDFDVSVYPLPIWDGKDRLIVMATGETVLFVEFGTGVHYAERHPLEGQFTGNGVVGRGEYGLGHGMRDAWGYYGDPGDHATDYAASHTGLGKDHNVTVTQGNPPARAMYDAEKEMRQRVNDIAKEVFSS